MEKFSHLKILQKILSFGLLTLYLCLIPSQVNTLPIPVIPKTPKQQARINAAIKAAKQAIKDQQESKRYK